MTFGRAVAADASLRIEPWDQHGWFRGSVRDP
jgi:hypothetical protein